MNTALSPRDWQKRPEPVIGTKRLVLRTYDKRLNQWRAFLALEKLWPAARQR